MTKYSCFRKLFSTLYSLQFLFSKLFRGLFQCMLLYQGWCLWWRELSRFVLMLWSMYLQLCCRFCFKNVCYGEIRSVLRSLWLSFDSYQQLFTSISLYLWSFGYFCRRIETISKVSLSYIICILSLCDWWYFAQYFGYHRKCILSLCFWLHDCTSKYSKPSSSFHSNHSLHSIQLGGLWNGLSIACSTSWFYHSNS